MPHTPPSNAIPSSNQIFTHSDHKLNETSGISFVSSITCSSYSKYRFWIIDSGANGHVCSSLHLFHSYYKIKPVIVFLPNGSYTL